MHVIIILKSSIKIKRDCPVDITLGSSAKRNSKNINIFKAATKLSLPARNCKKEERESAKLWIWKHNCCNALYSEPGRFETCLRIIAASSRFISSRRIAVNSEIPSSSSMSAILTGGPCGRLNNFMPALGDNLPPQFDRFSTGIIRGHPAECNKIAAQMPAALLARAEESESW
jgi:hypothetical protein